MIEEFPNLIFSLEAKENFDRIRDNPTFKIICKAARKALTHINNKELRHPSLHTHKYNELRGKNGEKVLVAYVQNKTPGAYRIFFHYGPEKEEITIVAITPHP